MVKYRRVRYIFYVVVKFINLHFIIRIKLVPDAAIWWCLWTGGGGVLTRDSIWPDQRRTDLMAVSLSFEIGGHRRDTIFFAPGFTGESGWR